jgi:hypothetical protein
MTWTSGQLIRRRVMVQEYISRTDPDKHISLEYKLYMFAERLAAIQVIDRASGEQEKMNYYTPEWEMIEEQMHGGHKHQDVFRNPDGCLKEMTACAERMGAAIGTYVRLDFILKDEGFAFGEMTFTPGGRGSYTPFGDQYFSRYWDEVCPDRF